MVFNRTNIIAFVNTFQKASASKNFEEVKPMIHPKALFRFNDGDYQGITNIKMAFENTWSHDIKNEKYIMNTVEIIHIDTNSATVTFNYLWSGDTLKGPIHIAGRGTQVLVVHEGALQIILEHLSR
ncbi:MAG: nuclear transport factor 2 family protein [Bacteroidota bacterium]